MTNPGNGGDEVDPFEEGQQRWERERAERERQEAEGAEAEGEPAEFEEAEFVEDEPDEQLRLADEDERLPWLETDDDYADDAVDTGRIAMVAFLGLLAVLAVVGLAWWLSRDKPDQELLAEGSTIAAPAGEMRDRPANPGGEQVEGTGDVSFAVGEGREGAATGTATPAAAASATPAPSAAATPSIDRNQAGAAAGAATASAATGGVGVQVGAYSSRAAAEAGWNQQISQHSALSGMNHRIEQASVDGNTVFRLQAVAGNAGAAQQLCRSIKSGGGDCRVLN